jgi:hypothetical protein
MKAVNKIKLTGRMCQCGVNRHCLTPAQMLKAGIALNARGGNPCASVS